MNPERKRKFADWGPQLSRPSDPKPDATIDEGRVLLRLPRGEGNEEVRISLRAFKDRPFIDVRAWWRSDEDGQWRPSKKGCSLRLKELPDVARTLGDPALRLAGGMRQGRQFPAPHDPAMELDRGGGE